MPDKHKNRSDQTAGGRADPNLPGHKGGNPVQNAEEWGGGSKASKGSPSGKGNPNSSAKS